MLHVPFRLVVRDVSRLSSGLEAFSCYFSKVLLQGIYWHLTFATWLSDRSLGDDSEKSVGSSDSVLLVRQNLCRCESHHGEKLGEKLCAELPPGVPDEILRSRQETTDRRSLQI